jgi:hypothetical protein
LRDFNEYSIIFLGELLATGYPVYPVYPSTRFAITWRAVTSDKVLHTNEIEGGVK